MIVKSTWRQAGGLEAHLLKTESNERVQVQTDLVRGADDLHPALRLMEAIARTNPRTKRAYIHVKVSPDHPLTEKELAQTLITVEAEHGISPDAPRAVVAHWKGTRASHVHAVYSVIDLATGRAVASHGNFERDELVSRRLELLFGERITPGPRIEANIAELRRRGLNQDADRLASFAPVRHKDGLSRADRQQASWHGVAMASWSATVFALFETSGRDLAGFSGLLERSGLSVACGDRAMLIVDDRTGFSTSLVRLLRREAKSAGQPLDMTERQVVAAFPTAPPAAQARDAGLERARMIAERDLAAERRTAFIEAAADADADELEAFRRRARKAERTPKPTHARMHSGRSKHVARPSSLSIASATASDGGVRT